jgi:hypothetical protein
MLDLIIVSRANLKANIPDECMLLGDVTLYPMVRRFNLMPIFVIAARVCPKGAEATLFALLMSLSNLGNTVAIYFGSFLMVLFGVTDNNYNNFIWVVLLKSICRLSALPLIPLFAPKGSAQDYEDHLTKDQRPSTTFRNSELSVQSSATKKEIEEEEEVDGIDRSTMNSAASFNSEQVASSVDSDSSKSKNLQAVHSLRSVSTSRYYNDSDDNSVSDDSDIIMSPFI